MTTESKELANMQAEMAKKIAELSATTTTYEKVNLTLGPNTITVPDIGETNTPMDCVVLDFITTRAYYDTPMPIGNKQPANSPACFALGRGSTDDFVPLADSPNIQHPTCKGCPKNEWGTAPRGGKGKACGEQRVVAIMLPAAKNQDDKIYTTRVTPSKLKDFDNYYRQIVNRTGKLPLFFISELSTAAVGTSNAAVFKLKSENVNYKYFWSRLQDANEILMRTPDFSGYKAP